MSYFLNIEVEEIPEIHPVRLFHKVWQSNVGSGYPVPWSSYKPQEIADVIPWLLLLERQEDDTYLYKVCGTSCESLFGMTYQGKTFGEDLPVEAVRQRRQEFDWIETGGKPIFSATTLPIPERDYREVFRGVFGFSSDGESIDKIGVVIAPK
ncbi:MAG: hypothetical protein AB3N28_15640 [Kordiimonas sp.]